jgi:hypothetical protein
MIVTAVVGTKDLPAVSLHRQYVKLDFGSILLEIDIEGFKNLIAALVMQAANQGIDLSTP